MHIVGPIACVYKNTNAGNHERHYKISWLSEVLSEQLADPPLLSLPCATILARLKEPLNHHILFALPFVHLFQQF